MKKLPAAAIAAAIAATAFAAPAHAGSTEGKWQIKVLGSAVLPDGKISQVDKDLIGLPAGSQTKASDNGVPTLAVEYFFTPNISAETICCTSSHHVTGAGPLAGAAIVDHAVLIPATLTLKYHLPLAGGIKPYIGAGPALYLWLGERPGAAAASLGAARVHLSNEVVPRCRAAWTSRSARRASGSASMPRSTGSTPLPASTPPAGSRR